MNRSALVSHVAAETSVTRITADTLAYIVFSAIADTLVRDEIVAIAGFGRFAMRRRPEREGRNPQTGEPVTGARHDHGRRALIHSIADVLIEADGQDATEWLGYGNPSM